MTRVNTDDQYSLFPIFCMVLMDSKGAGSMNDRAPVIRKEVESFPTHTMPGDKCPLNWYFQTQRSITNFSLKNHLKMKVFLDFLNQL